MQEFTFYAVCVVLLGFGVYHWRYVAKTRKKILQLTESIERLLVSNDKIAHEHKRLFDLLLKFKSKTDEDKPSI